MVVLTTAWRDAGHLTSGSSRQPTTPRSLAARSPYNCADLGFDAAGLRNAQGQHRPAADVDPFARTAATAQVVFPRLTSARVSPEQMRLPTAPRSLAPPLLVPLRPTVPAANRDEQADDLGGADASRGAARLKQLTSLNTPWTEPAISWVAGSGPWRRATCWAHQPHRGGTPPRLALPKSREGLAVCGPQDGFKLRPQRALPTTLAPSRTSRPRRTCQAESLPKQAFKGPTSSSAESAEVPSNQLRHRAGAPLVTGRRHFR